MSIQYWRCMVCWEMNKLDEWETDRVMAILFLVLGSGCGVACKCPDCGGVCEAVK